MTCLLSIRQTLRWNSEFPPVRDTKRLIGSIKRSDPLAPRLGQLTFGVISEKKLHFNDGGRQSDSLTKSSFKCSKYFTCPDVLVSLFKAPVLWLSICNQSDSLER